MGKMLAFSGVAGAASEHGGRDSQKQQLVSMLTFPPLLRVLIYKVGFC